jgi:hypothetical protein
MVGRERDIDIYRERYGGRESERERKYWVGSAVDRKSTSGSSFTLGSAMVFWCRKKQRFVSLSIARGRLHCTKCGSFEAVWLLKLFD